MSKFTKMSVISAVMLCTSVVNGADCTDEAVQKVIDNLQQTHKDMASVRDAMDDVKQAMSEVRNVVDKLDVIIEKQESAAEKMSWFSGWFGK